MRPSIIVINRDLPTFGNATTSVVVAAITTLIQITVLETAAAALKKQKRMADHFRWHYLGEVE